MNTIISNNHISATINSKGAELTSILALNTNKEYIWNANPEFWGKHSPILYPIVGTLKDNTYTYKNKLYSLSRHGFARDMVFDLLYKTSNEVVFALVSDETTKEFYPFDFELQIKYTIHNSSLNIVYKVINKGLDVLYYAIGGHPAFNLSSPIENYELLFECSENLLSFQLENDLISDKTNCIELKEKRLPLSYSLFKNDALIFKEMKSKQIQLIENNTALFNFRFNDFPNFGIWTKMNAPFICLEPWVGYSDVYNSSGHLIEKEGIQRLDCQSSKEYSFSIEIL